MEFISLSQRKINLIDLIVLASYYFFSTFLLLSLLGLFRREFIVASLAAGFLLFLIFFWRKVELPKNYLYFFILIPILLTGILLVRGSFGGDGIIYWLPWAREIVLQERMPDFLLNTSAWLTTREPLLPLFYAGLFSLFGFGDWAIAILPFFFAVASAFLIYLWLLEKGVKKIYIFFGILLLLTSPLFLDRAGEIGQEPLILFFFTAFLYYLEKFQKTSSPFYFLLLFLSATLAAVSKWSGLILFLPLVWLFIKIIKNQPLKRPYFYLFLTFPLFLWLLRNYIIYDNPVLPLLNEVFRGRYYNLILTTNQIFQNFQVPFWDNILARITEIPISLFVSFFPLIILSFYEFWKKRKIQYILLFLIFFLLIFFMMPNPGDYVRYFMPLLGVFIVYAVIGLEEIKSRIFLSIVFFLNLWGLFFTKLAFSKSQFFSPVEEKLSIFGNASRFVHDHSLLLALALSIFFFFLVSSRRQPAKYLILLSVSAYLVKAYSFHLGSWLNVWLPILGLIFIILVWRLAIKLKEETLQKLVISFIVILLILNSWGLASAYFLAHKQFFFPNFTEAYESQPALAAEIEKLERENRDFYIYGASSSYFVWYHNLKVVIPREPTFYIVTNLEYDDNLNSLEIHSLFKRSKIKYVVNNNLSKSQLDPIFDKIKSQPDLFEPIFQHKETDLLWRVK